MFTLTVNNLSKQRAYDDIFSDISFELNSGELLWVKGANGSGKTSLLRVLAGLSKQSSGEVSFTQSDSESRAYYYVSHQINLIDSLTVKETIEHLFPLYQVGSVSSLDDFLKQAELSGTESLRVSQLSAGQKQRLNLLMLCNDYRALWLLDEPYNNLDANGREWLNTLIKSQQEANGAVIIVSHADSLGVTATNILELDTV